jgi:hypothetical protein
MMFAAKTEETRTANFTARNKRILDEWTRLGATEYEPTTMRNETDPG